MARPTNETIYQNLCKELGRIDAERRAILKRLKQTPEFVSKYLADTLNAFIVKKSWFARSNAKGEQAYFKLVGYKFTGNGEAIKLSDVKAKNLISVDLEWDFYDYNTVSKKKSVEHVFISVFNDIEKQILNGRKEANSFDEKKLLKAQLTEKKEKLKAELKELEAALKTI
jgi:predicted transcriptional regulator